MNTSSTFMLIDQKELLNYCQTKYNEGWRFIQMHAVAGDGVNDLYYSFMKDNHIENATIKGVAKNDHIPSITALFLAAFVFENEARELFGVTIDNIAIDFQGRFYDLSESTPMNASITLHPAGESTSTASAAPSTVVPSESKSAESNPVLQLRKERISNLNEKKRELFNAALKKKGLSLDDVLTHKSIRSTSTDDKATPQKPIEKQSHTLKDENAQTSSFASEDLAPDKPSPLGKADTQLNNLLSCMDEQRASIVKAFLEEKEDAHV